MLSSRKGKGGLKAIIVDEKVYLPGLENHSDAKFMLRGKPTQATGSQAGL